MRGRRAALIGSVALVACRGVLGLGDPEPYDGDGGPNTLPNGETPVATADAAACGNANLVVDAKNCGRCGHDCRGGRCERARCVPVPVTAADSEVFAVRDGKVYTVSTGKIIRVEPAADKFQGFELAKTAVGTPHSMIASSTHIVWSGDDTGVRVCSLTGCGADDPVQLSAAGKKTGPVTEVPALNQLYPYIWANYTDSTVEKATSTPNAPVVLSTNTHVLENPCGPAFAPIDAGAVIYDTPSKHFWVYPAAEAAGRDAGGADTQCAIAANATDVFYTDATTIWRSAVNPDGTLAPRVPFAQDLLAPKVLAADDEFVYWAASTPEADIVRCRVAGCDGAPEVLVEAIPTVQSLHVEGAFLYFDVFLNPTLGRVIYRVAK
jgi:hypothetical protein